MKRYLLLLVLISFTIPVYCQQITFSKTYYSSGNHNAYSFIELPDSGFLLNGFHKESGQPFYSYSMRTDKYGDSIWTKKYAPSGALSESVVLNDSFIITAGSFDTARLSVQVGKLNYNGDTLVVKDFGYPPPGGANGVEKTPDGGFVIRSSGTQDYEFLKLDSNLNEQWHYNIYNMPWGCNKILPDPAGGYVAIGSGNVNLQPYVVSRFDSAGNQIWQYNYGNQPAWDAGNERNPRDLIFLADSNFMICTDGFDWQLMKINRMTGDTMWTRNYYDSAFPNVYNLPVAMDYAGNNHYILANNGNNSKIMLLDENGDTLWTRPKPWYWMQIYEIKKTSDGGFAMCGYYYANSSTFLLAFAKIDSLGNGVFTSVFNPANNFQQLNIYPNPFTEKLMVSQLKMGEKTSIVIYDVMGATVYQQELSSNKTSAELNLSFLQQGVYFLNVKSDGESLTKKIVKM